MQSFHLKRWTPMRVLRAYNHPFASGLSLKCQRLKTAGLPVVASDMRRVASCVGAGAVLFPADNMQDPDFADIVGLICKEDPRFDRRAYDFIRLGLDHTVKELKKKENARAAKSRHVSGPELLEGLRVYALEQFGPLAKTVLDSWGIRKCSDFGDIVFNLIDYNVFSKTDNDRREDFSDVYSFEDAFVKPFLPEKSRRGSSGVEAA